MAWKPVIETSEEKIDRLTEENEELKSDLTTTESAVADLMELNDKLRELCDDHFVRSMVQPYAGANLECLYCGAVEQRNGACDHSAADCPTIKYQVLNHKEGQ